MNRNRQLCTLFCIIMGGVQIFRGVNTFLDFHNVGDHNNIIKWPTG